LVSAGESSWRIEKAERFMQAAERAFEASDYETAVSRAYYSVFHGVMATLEAHRDRVIVPKSHAQLHGLLHNRLGMSLGIFDSDQVRAFRRLFRWRQRADYELLPFDQEAAREIVLTAARLNARLSEVRREG
jgi:uncharacterized protein (UPF0332 family)